MKGKIAAIYGLLYIGNKYFAISTKEKDLTGLSNFILVPRFLSFFFLSFFLSIFFCFVFGGWASHSNGNDKSWVQKERLLRFDREFARRTQIFDDQADFQSPTTWMSEQERMDAEESENNRIDAMNRPKQTLSLSIG